MKTKREILELIKQEEVEKKIMKYIVDNFISEIDDLARKLYNEKYPSFLKRLFADENYLDFLLAARSIIYDREIKKENEKWIN